MYKGIYLSNGQWFRDFTHYIIQNSRSYISKHGRVSSDPPRSVCCRAAIATSSAVNRINGKDRNVVRHSPGKGRTGIRRGLPNHQHVPALPKIRTVDDVIKPVDLSPEQCSGPNIGEELTNELDRDKLIELLDRVLNDTKILELLNLKLSIRESMLECVLKSFRSYCLLSSVLPVDLHILIYDLIHGTGMCTDLVPHIVEHAGIVYPHLNVLDDLKHLIGQNMSSAVSWYPETRKMKRKIIYHCGPTNSGKTYAALQRFMDAKTGVYLAPLRLLAIECFTKTNEQDVPCDLLTGERKYYIESEDSPANHRACTIELLDFSAKYDVAVIDEIQMIGDLFRGGYWTQSLLGVIAEEVHVCGDGSALEIVEKLVKQCGDSFEVIKYQRKTPLVIQREPLSSLENVRAGDCIVCFQVKQLFNVGEQLKNLGHNCALIYGALPPGIKIKQTEAFNDPNNSCNILVATDAVGMGLNLAIQRIIFYGVEKIGLRENKGELIDRYLKEHMVLSTSEAMQIAGRAGRYGGHYEKEGGQVTALNATDLKMLRHILKQEIPKIERAGLVLRGDVIETFGYYLPGVPFSRILMMFLAMCETDGEYFMCDTSPLVKNAMLTDHIDMPLRDKLVFCQSPLRHRVSARGIQVYVQMAQQISETVPMTLTWFLNQVQYPRSRTIKDVTQFEHALEVFHLTDIFMWLSFKFHEFQTIESMREFRTELDKALRDYIETNYSSIDKGTVLQLASSSNIRTLVAEKGTLSADRSTRNPNDEEDVVAKSNLLLSSIRKDGRVVAKPSKIINDNGISFVTDGCVENNSIGSVNDDKTARVIPQSRNDLNQHDNDDPLARIWYKFSGTSDPAADFYRLEEVYKHADADKSEVSKELEEDFDVEKDNGIDNFETYTYTKSFDDDNVSSKTKEAKTETEEFEEKLTRKMFGILDGMERGSALDEQKNGTDDKEKTEDSKEPSTNPHDPKAVQPSVINVLLMYVQKQGISDRLKFQVISTEGPPHQPVFTMGIEGFDCVAKGNSKKEAMHRAASLALTKLQEEGKLQTVLPGYKIQNTPYTP